jgi:hypothetical protein
MKKRTDCDLKKLMERRKEYRTVWKNKHIDQFVSVDEVGFGNTCVPIYGYSRKGHPAIIKHHASRRKRLNVIMAVTYNCEIRYKYVYGTVDSNLFSEFISELPWQEPKYIIMDNASIHRTLSTQKQCGEKNYCPNPKP